MNLEKIAIFLFFSTFLPHVKSQKILQQGVISYQKTTSENAQDAPSEESNFYFGPQMSLLQYADAQNSVKIWILSDYEKAQLNIIKIEGADTIANFTALDTSARPKYMNGFVMKPSRKKKKKLLGYNCTYLKITTPGEDPLSIEIDAWVTTQIQSTKLPPIIDLGLSLPGFPLEFQLVYTKSGTKLNFNAQGVSYLPDSLLEAQKRQFDDLADHYIRNEQMKRDARQKQYKNKLAFLNDTTIHWLIPVDTLWQVLQTNNRAFALESKPLNARFVVSREALQAAEGLEAQMEELLVSNQNYLVVLQSPAPAIQTIELRGKPSKQQIWNFHKQAILDNNLFPVGYSPYDFLPMEDLVEIHQVFCVRDMLCRFSIQTTLAQTADVMQSVFRILEALDIKSQ